MTDAVQPPQFLEPTVDTHIPLPCGCGPGETCCKCPIDRVLDAQHDRAPEHDEEAVQATPTATPPRPEAPPQAPMAAGTYAVYDDQQGGYVLVIGTREGDTHHKHIPAKVVKMGEMMMGGNSPLAALFGGA
jgi:hypothetical protein